MSSRVCALIAIACGLVCLAASGHVRAGPPETVHSYRFVPRHSALTLGWRDREAPDFLIPIRGTFDFVTFQGDPSDPWKGLYGRFEHVDAGGPHPIQDVIVDLDEALNLSGLSGRQLPVMGPFDMFEFQGKNSVGHDVQLFATLIGPWFLLRGETTPTPASIDPRYYAIDAVARQRPFADFNDDAVVNSDDLTAWSDNFGSANMTLDATDHADADGDGDADGADLLAWQQALGEQAPGNVAFALGGNVAAPEPTTGLLAGPAMASVLGALRRRASSE